MILLLLRDGSFAEIPTGADVIHRNRTLRCLSSSGDVLASFNASEVTAYTCNEISARRIRTQGARPRGYERFANEGIEEEGHMTYDIDQLMGKTIYTSENEKAGEIDEVYLDDQSGKPEWARIGVGLFGMKNVLVPLSPLTEEGDGMRAPYSKEMIKDAPSIEGDYVSPEEESELYRYYGLASASPSELNEMRGAPDDRMQQGPPVKPPLGEAPMADQGRTALGDKSMAGADGARLRRWTRL